MNTPYIIAEVGSNWADLQDCLDSVRLAKAAGADAVKFQLFTHESLYGMPGLDSEKTNPYLSEEWLPKLKAYADQLGIDFLCSAFSPELIDVVDPFVKMHKVASSELSHQRMLEKLKAIGKTVLLSTGGSGHSDIEQALQILGTSRTILLYCVSSYPAREVDLENIPLLRNQFRCPVGFSDHTLDICNVPKFAVQYYGANVVEKHFTPSNDLSSSDVAHSLTADEFHCMVESIRRISIVRGPEHTSNRMYHYAGSEQDMITRHNRRLIATRDIPYGDMLKEGYNFGIYRSLKDETHAFGGFMVNQADRKTALKTIKAGDGIGPGDF